MPDPDDTRRTSIDAAAPASRIRVVIGLIVAVVVLGVLSWRALR